MPDLLHHIPIKAPPETVYAALATETGLRCWWTADTLAEESVGGRAQFGFNKRAVTFRMTIEELTPPARVDSCAAA